MKNTYIAFVVILVLVGAGSFYGGMKYQSSKDASAAPSFAAGGTFGGGTGTSARRTAGQFGAGARGGANGGVVAGTVSSIDAQSMTVQMRDGSSKVIFITPDTKVEKTVDGAIGDVAAQANVTVMGTTNSDGSVTAATVQIRPVGMGFPFGQGTASSTSASSTK